MGRRYCRGIGLSPIRGVRWNVFFLAGKHVGRRRILNIEGPEQQGDEYADIVDELARDIDEEYEEAGNY